MCQPGRPGPQGESHDGSPGFAAFHMVKSAGSRFPPASVSPCTISSIRWPDRNP